MRHAFLVAACIAAVATPAWADVLEVERDMILRELTTGQITKHRSLCVSGGMPATIAKERAAGVGHYRQTLSAGQYCVTVLTRQGRDGTLGYMRLADGATTPALTFDTGFVNGYRKREAVPANAPTMAALLPVADRCLDQKEPNARLCNAAGYMLGLRAAQGELVPLAL